MGSPHPSAGAPAKEVRVSTLSLEECADVVVQERVAAAREEGRLAGIDEAHKGAAELLRAAVERLDQAREETLLSVSRDSVALALEIARQVILVEVEDQHHNLEAMVRETLSFSEVGRGACVVHVAPADAELLADIPFRSATRIESDPQMCVGDVHVTTPDGTLVRETRELLESIRQRLERERA